MNWIPSLFAHPETIGLLMTIFGVVLTAIINRAAAAFTLATGIEIERKHREALHQAIRSGVESTLLHGGKTGAGTVKAHVVQHLRESVPDALAALSPSDTVLTRLIDRYAREALAKIGEPK